MPSCAGLTGPALAGSFAAALANPTGGLSGTGTIINVLSGRDTMYNARAFGAWNTAASYSDIGNDLPNFSTTTPAAAITVDPGLGEVFFTSWTATTNAFFTVSAGAEAASATMMHTDVINEFILDSATASDTDWVLTFPTKRLFVDPNDRHVAVHERADRFRRVRSDHADLLQP